MSVYEIEEFFGCGSDIAFALHRIYVEVHYDVKAQIPPASIIAVLLPITLKRNSISITFRHFIMLFYFRQKRD